MNALWETNLDDCLNPMPASADDIVVLDGVHKIYPGRSGVSEVVALESVSFRVARGAILGVIGRSGAGKSTLIRLLSGLERPTAGTIAVDGIEFSALDEARLRKARRSIGPIFQHFNLLSSRTVFGNVSLPLEIAGWPRREIKARVDALLELVGLSDKRDRYTAELSGGQKQRVGIARALATGPKVLLSDEATSALDPETTRQILALLDGIRKELNLTIILVTHEMSVVRAIADDVIVLDGGRIVESGSTFDIFAHPKSPTTIGFVSTAGGTVLPANLPRQLQADPLFGGKAIIRIVFSGPQAGEPVLSRLTRLLGADINILAGQVDAVAGRPFGTLIVAIPVTHASVPAAVGALTRLGLSAEVLGYVP
jgi:D-methionine transport system ATP-binding protein